MELRQLRYFVAIARQGSLSKAAGEIFIAQSALSYQLAQLEAEVGSELLQRLPRGVQLTEAGRAFLPHAISVLKQAEDAKASVAAVLGKPIGKVTFGLPPSLCGVLPLPLLMAVRSALPGVELELTEEMTTSLSSQLRDGSIDLAILFEDGTLNEFSSYPLMREEMFLVSRKDVEAKSNITFEKALSLPLLLPARKQGVRPIIETLARKLGLPPPNVVGEINSVLILRSTLVAGLGHTLTTAMAVQPDVANGQLALTRIEDISFYRTLVLCTLRQAPLTAAAAAVLAIAMSVASDLLASRAWIGGQAVEEN